MSNNLSPEMIEQVQKSFSGFIGRRILVIGDAVADQFLFGTIDRPSREAPVFILKHQNTETRPGAAANTAANISAMGGRAVLLSVVGEDQSGTELKENLLENKVDTSCIISLGKIQTTRKLRVLAGHQMAARQQVIRIDYSDDALAVDFPHDKILKLATEQLHLSDAIVFSDYGYGVVSKQLFEFVNSEASKRNIPVLVDSRHNLTLFCGAFAATPNLEEAEEVLQKPLDDNGVKELVAKLGLEVGLITMGSRGLYITGRNGLFRHIEAFGTKEPVDVTGAGDTVLAAFSMAIAGGASPETAAVIANCAGGLSVLKRGTAVVSLEELKNALVI